MKTGSATTDARRRLEESQAALVRALVSQGPVPAGFDESRVRAAARSLVSKRRQALTRGWPHLVRAAGDVFVERFTAYATAHPLPLSASTLGDGRAFLAWLARQQPLSDELIVEALSFDMRFVETRTGLRRRRFALRTTMLPISGTRILAMRLPWIGERWWRWPRRVSPG